VVPAVPEPPPQPVRPRVRQRQWGVAGDPRLRRQGVGRPGRAGRHQYREAVRAVLDDDHPRRPAGVRDDARYGYITSWHLDGNVLSVAKDPACPKVPGDGTFRGLGGIVGSSPNDMWLSPDGAYLYQIYPNASELVGYAIQADGSLDQITSASIPYNSPQGLAGLWSRLATRGDRQCEIALPDRSGLCTSGAGESKWSVPTRRGSERYGRLCWRAWRGPGRRRRAGSPRGWLAPAARPGGPEAGRRRRGGCRRGG
jgi:hypothetical protein